MNATAANATFVAENATSEASNATNATAGNATNATAVNETQGVNMTSLWIPEYDHDNLTKEMIIENMTARGLYKDFQLWYLIFFGTSTSTPGLVPLNFTQQAGGANETAAANQTANQTSGGARLLQGAADSAQQNVQAMFVGGATEIPAGMENIVAMIHAMVNLKMKQIDVAKYLNDSGALPYGVPVTGLGQELSNMTNETAGNATNVTNVTIVVIAPSAFFNVSEYQPSNTCQIQGNGAAAANTTGN